MNNVGGVTYTQHKFGFAADMGFSNTTKSMDVSSALGIPNGGFFTFSFWIKMNTEITTGIQYFVVHDDNATGTEYLIAYNFNGGTRRIEIDRTRFGITTDQAMFNITLGTENFYHIAYTYDGSRIRLFINGIMVASTTSTGSGTSGTVPTTFFIGRGGATFTSVMYEELAVWGRALSINEISRYYNWALGNSKNKLMQFAPPPPSFPDPTAHLVFYSRLDGNTEDESGSGFHLTNNNSTPFSPGRFGLAARFNGTNQSLTRGAPVSTKTKNFSFGCWVFSPNATINGGFMQNGKGDTDPADDGYALWKGGSAGSNAGNNWGILFGGQVWQTFGDIGKTGWHFIMVTVDNNQITRGYLDGIQQGPTFSNVPATPTNNFAIGNVRENNMDNFWGDKIDEVAFFEGVLTPQQIEDYYLWAIGMKNRYKQQFASAAAVPPVVSNGRMFLLFN